MFFFFFAFFLLSSHWIIYLTKYLRHVTDRIKWQNVTVDPIYRAELQTQPVVLACGFPASSIKPFSLKIPHFSISLCLLSKIKINIKKEKKGYTLILWYSALGSCLQSQCVFELWLLHIQPSSLLIWLGKQQRMAQALGPVTRGEAQKNLLHSAWP